ncbi:hypothetical protein PHYBOEH_000775 [Phytophthora boehmeriae]|uniref:Uncharacterized protein n=1 Tax=Phytophthora boehmeriae TaxID=109152 RepID=A0A8T1WW93_9STRA|nr:hypothetical protein PHYBOEH_000775 [Phytophthora boehmeriae]
MQEDMKEKDPDDVDDGSSSEEEDESALYDVHKTLTELVALESAEEDSKLKVDAKKWRKHALVIRRFFSYVLTAKSRCE